MRLALLCQKQCLFACTVLACLTISTAAHVPADQSWWTYQQHKQASGYARVQTAAVRPFDSTPLLTSKSSAWRCPAESLSLLRKAASLSLKFKGLGTIEKACDWDSGCYSTCFCTSVKTTVAVLATVDIDRGHEAWDSCMKQAWQMMVKPRVPKEARDAWKSNACPKAPNCG